MWLLAALAGGVPALAQGTEPPEPPEAPAAPEELPVPAPQEAESGEEGDPEGQAPEATTEEADGEEAEEAEEEEPPARIQFDVPFSDESGGGVARGKAGTLEYVTQEYVVATGAEHFLAMLLVQVG